MKRENLDFLDNEQIEKVMALYGKAIAKKETCKAANIVFLEFKKKLRSE